MRIMGVPFGIEPSRKRQAEWRNAHERPHLQALSPLDRWQDLWRDQPQLRGRRRGLRTRGPPPAVPSGRGDLADRPAGWPPRARRGRGPPLTARRPALTFPRPVAGGLAPGRFLATLPRPPGARGGSSASETSWPSPSFCPPPLSAAI